MVESIPSESTYVKYAFDPIRMNRKLPVGRLFTSLFVVSSETKNTNLFEDGFPLPVLLN